MWLQWRGGQASGTGQVPVEMLLGGPLPPPLPGSDGPREPRPPPPRGPGKPLRGLRIPRLCPSGRQLLWPVRRNLQRAEKVKWAHLPFLLLFLGVAVLSENECLGLWPILSHCEFCSERVGGRVVSSGHQLPPAAVSPPRRAGAWQTLLPRPPDLCLQGSWGSSVRPSAYRWGN